MSSENDTLTVSGERPSPAAKPASSPSGERREVRATLFEFLQNFTDSFARIFVGGNGPANHQIICAGLDRFARRHESLLIAGLRPTRSISMRHPPDSTPLSSPHSSD